MTNRIFLLLTILAACVLAAAAAHAQAAAAEPGKPNILVIYTDDHGWADLGAQGVDPDIRTPHLDRLAQDGVRFHRGYVTAPQCVPSRAGLVAGRHQNRFGVEDNLKGPLPLDVVTIPERLQRAGYVTGMSGKWHLDLVRAGDGRGQRADASYLPPAHGFDEYWCGAMRQYHASHDLQGNALPEAPKLVADARFRIPVQTEAALGFLDRRAADPERPWFFYLAWFAPHVPLESAEPWFSRTPDHLPLERRQALAMIAAMDEGLGQIRDKLRAMGAERNTLLFFISDNGAPLRQGAWDGSLNLPLVGEKGMLTDGGVRVPFVAAWPNRLPAGLVYDHPVSALDVGATAVALAGLPHDDQLDGVNLIPFLTGDKSGPPHETLYWRWRSQAAVLEFPWKLILLGDQERYLFDVTEPDGETKNLVEQAPDVAVRLEAKFKAWSASLQPPGPAEPHNEQDIRFFADHVDQRLATQAAPRGSIVADGSLQGWLCRNGTLEIKDGVLVVTPDAGAKAGPFITRSGLDWRGPLTVTLATKTARAGKLAVAWRTAGQKDFVPENAVRADVTSALDGQTHTLTVPEKRSVIHLRVHFPAGTTEIRQLEITDTQGKQLDSLPTQKLL